jgi:hypothetical protein
MNARASEKVSFTSMVSCTGVGVLGRAGALGATRSSSEDTSSVLVFMALDPKTAFSPEHCKQKVIRKWLLYLHDDILESVKELNNGRLPLRYPGAADPVKDARDAMVHAEKLLSAGVIYALSPTSAGGEAPANVEERFNFMYHVNHASG